MLQKFRNRRKACAGILLPSSPHFPQTCSFPFVPGLAEWPVTAPVCLTRTPGFSLPLTLAQPSSVSQAPTTCFSATTAALPFLRPCRSPRDWPPGTLSLAFLLQDSFCRLSSTNINKPGKWVTRCPVMNDGMSTLSLAVAFSNCKSKCLLTVRPALG